MNSLDFFSDQMAFNHSGWLYIVQQIHRSLIRLWVFGLLQSSPQSSFFSSSPFSSTEPISSISSSSSSVPLSTSFARASWVQYLNDQHKNSCHLMRKHSHCKPPRSQVLSFPVREPEGRLIKICICKCVHLFNVHLCVHTKVDMLL